MPEEEKGKEACSSRTPEPGTGGHRTAALDTLGCPCLAQPGLQVCQEAEASRTLGTPSRSAPPANTHTLGTEFQPGMLSGSLEKPVLVLRFHACGTGPLKGL